MEKFFIGSQDGKAVVVMQTDFTNSLLPELQEKLKTIIDEGIKEIVFDLTNSKMLDSKGIGLLVATKKSLDQKQAKIKVINVSHYIFQLLCSMRLDTFLNATEKKEG
jgi:anti-anti-sigma factor